ncbi:hypothetical protein BDR22DRAFT_889930 [Usnea florida]
MSSFSIAEFFFLRSLKFFSQKSVKFADTTESITFLNGQESKSILKTRTSRQPLCVEGQRRRSEDSGGAIKKAERRKELASIRDARKLFRLVERAQTRWQDQKLRVLADVDTRLEAARAEYSRVSCIKKPMQGWKYARSLMDIDKHLKFARKEVEEALSAKISVLRQQQGEAKIWQNMLAQIGEETAKEAAR